MNNLIYWFRRKIYCPHNDPIDIEEGQFGCPDCGYYVGMEGYFWKRYIDGIKFKRAIK